MSQTARLARLLQASTAEIKPWPRVPREVIARGRQAAQDIRAIEAAAGVPMLEVMRRYDATIEAIDTMEQRS